MKWIKLEKGQTIPESDNIIYMVEHRSPYELNHNNGKPRLSIMQYISDMDEYDIPVAYMEIEPYIAER